MFPVFPWFWNCCLLVVCTIYTFLWAFVITTYSFFESRVIWIIRQRYSKTFLFMSSHPFAVPSIHFPQRYPVFWQLFHSPHIYIRLEFLKPWVSSPLFLIIILLVVLLYFIKNIMYHFCNTFLNIKIFSPVLLFNIAV